jgi:hypothetical protein
VQRRVLREVAGAARGWGARPAGIVDSGLPGAKGNREFVIHLVQAGHGGHGDPPAVLERWIDDAVG